MAQLIGVKTVGNGSIEYEGVRYVETGDDAIAGDIVRHDAGGYSWVPRGTYYIVIDRGGGDRIEDEDGDYVGVDDDFTVFRREEVTLTTAELIEQTRAKLADLEAKLADETTLKVGDYARVTEANPADDDVSVGDIVVVDGTDGIVNPYRVRTIITIEEDSSGWAWVPAATKLTPTEARAALIAQIDALFAPVSP